MSECKCLSSTYRILVYRWTKPHHFFWGGKGVYPVVRKVVTIQGDSLDEIERKRDGIVSQIKGLYPEPDYETEVYLHD